MTIGFLLEPFKHCLSWGHPLLRALFSFVFCRLMPKAKASLVVFTEFGCSGLSRGH